MDFPDCEPITRTWLRENHDCVAWDPPLYRYNDTGFCSCWQIGIAQGINTAGRRDQNAWYVVSRWSRCSEVTRPDSLRIVSNTPSPTVEKAVQELKRKRQKRENDGGWERSSPCLKSLIDHKLLFERENDEPNFTNGSRLVIQPTREGDPLYAWVEANTGYLQMYNPTTSIFVDHTDPAYTNILDYLQDILRARPNVFLVCKMVTRSSILVYDAFYHPISPKSIRSMPSTATFTKLPLDERLRLLRGLIMTQRQDHIGSCVDIAPFQVAESKGELKDHKMIYLSGCFTDCMVRAV
jgi:hypothetical protein